MKNVLVICGDYYHSEEIIRLGFEHLEMEEVVYDIIVDAKNILSPTMASEYDLIINCKGNAMTPHNPTPIFTELNCEFGIQDLQNYVKSGAAFMAIHAGISFNKETAPEYTQLVGCTFVTHPPRCQVKVEGQGEHKILCGVESFTVQDEHYITESDGTEERNVFLKTVSQEVGEQVGGYTKYVGNGKVCVITPGHVLDVWKQPSFQRLVKNAIQWCLE